MIFIKVLVIIIWHLKNKKYTKKINQQGEGMTLSDNHYLLEMKPSIAMIKEDVFQMYNYDYSWASPEPQIKGPSTLVKTSTLPKTEDKVDSSVLGTRAAHPSHLVFFPKSMATMVTSDHRHYRGGHSRRQYAVWAGYLSPQLSSDIPEGILDTQNIQRRCKRMWATFVYSMMLSHIYLYFKWSGPG